MRGYYLNDSIVYNGPVGGMGGGFGGGGGRGGPSSGSLISHNSLFFDALGADKEDEFAGKFNLGTLNGHLKSLDSWDEDGSSLLAGFDNGMGSSSNRGLDRKLSELENKLEEFNRIDNSGYVDGDISLDSLTDVSAGTLHLFAGDRRGGYVMDGPVAMSAASPASLMYDYSYRQINCRKAGKFSSQ